MRSQIFAVVQYRIFKPIQLILKLIRKRMGYYLINYANTVRFQQNFDIHLPTSNAYKLVINKFTKWYLQIL